MGRFVQADQDRTDGVDLGELHEQFVGYVGCVEVRKNQDVRLSLQAAERCET